MTQDIISKLYKSRVYHGPRKGITYQSELVDLIRSIQESLPAGVYLSRWHAGAGGVHITYAIHHGPRADRSNGQPGLIASTVLHSTEGKTAQCEAYAALTALYDRYLFLKQYKQG